MMDVEVPYQVLECVLCLLSSRLRHNGVSFSLSAPIPALLACDIFVSGYRVLRVFLCFETMAMNLPSKEILFQDDGAVYFIYSEVA